MPLYSATTAASGFRKRLLTMPAALRHHGYEFIHLLDRQQGAERTPVTGLAAPLASRRQHLALPQGLG